MKLKYVLSTLILPLLFSCDDYLDKPASDDITADMAFETVIAAKKVLNNLYAEVKSSAYNINTRNAPYAQGCDDAIAGYSLWGNTFHNGSWTPDDSRTAADNAENTPPTCSFWNNTYKRVRKANLFLENLHKATGDEKDKVVLRAEAKFLRAYYYSELIKRFGGFILLDHSVDANDYSSLTNQPRNTFEECVDWVCAELDEAAKDLAPIRISSETGRATNVACYAVKARLLLFAASPLFNTDNPVLSDYTTIQYYGNYDKERWKKAADACKLIMNYSQYYGLDMEVYDTGDPTSYDNYFRRYSTLFFKVGRESVWISHPQQDWSGVRVPYGNRAAGGWNWINPTYQLAMEYEMTNGKLPAEQGSGYDLANPGNDRDPRFKSSIQYPGAQYPAYDFKPWIGGSASHLESQKTGFCMNKYLDPDFNSMTAGLVVRKNITQLFRYAEVLLNYAEAMNEYSGPAADVYQAINDIRARVGMPALPSGLDQAQMREKIRHERRVELAFEDHRFFDVRRWRIAEEALNGSLTGYDVTNGEKTGFYRIVTVGDPIKFEKRHYLYPLSTQEILLNPELQQNPGWPRLSTN